MGDDGIEMRVVFRDREEASVYLVLGSLTLVYSAAETPLFVGGTCAPSSALLVRQYFAPSNSPGTRKVCKKIFEKKFKRVLQGRGVKNWRLFRSMSLFRKRHKMRP